MKKVALGLVFVIILTCVLSGCSGTEKVTPETALEGYWVTVVSGVSISYKFENGSYYGKLATVVKDQIVDTEFSLWGTYKVNVETKQITLTSTDGKISRMRYEFSNDEITYLTSIAQNGWDGSKFVRVSGLKK